MVFGGRLVAALLLGIAAVVLRPHAGTVLLWLVIVAAATGVDVWQAGSPRRLTVERIPADPVRLGESSQSSLLVGNDGPRRLRGVLRDAWVPSAGAAGTRPPLDLPVGERRRLTTTLTPTRR